jgi:pimeloyl-ACP methyl ester carboxylesterase
VTPTLQAFGHEVRIPLLSGLENDSNLRTPAVGLRTHIENVISLLTRENLQDVTLVGHSYAGMVITGVAEHALHRLNHLAYVDAFVPATVSPHWTFFPRQSRSCSDNRPRILERDGGCGRAKGNSICGA